MKDLQLTPIFGGPLAAEPVRLGETPGHSAAFVLRRQDENGNLAAEPVEHVDNPLGGPCGDGALALLRWSAAGRDPAWLLMPCSDDVGLNGMTPPFPLARLEPGDLLSSGDRFWMIATLWRPEAVEAPADLRDKPCPVCGGNLAVAPVIQCPCGRWVHLENPAEPDNPDALNCFLASGVCGGCGRRASLEPQVIPDVPEKLAAAPLDEDAWS